MNRKSSKRLSPSNKWSTRRKASPMLSINNMDQIQEELKKIEEFVKEGKSQHGKIQGYLNSQIQSCVDKAGNFEEFQREVFDASANNFVAQKEEKKKLAELPFDNRIGVEVGQIENDVDSLEKGPKGENCGKWSLRSSINARGNVLLGKENMRSSKEFTFKKNRKEKFKKNSDRPIAYQSLDPRKLDLGGIRDNCDSASEEERVLDVAMHNSQDTRLDQFFKKRQQQPTILQFKVKNAGSNKIVKIASCSEMSDSSMSNRPEDIRTERSEFESKSSKPMLVPLVNDMSFCKGPPVGIEEETSSNTELDKEEEVGEEPLGQKEAQNSIADGAVLEEISDEHDQSINASKNLTQDESSILYSGMNFVKKNESFFDKKMRRIEDDYKDLMSELKQQYRFEVTELKSRAKKSKRREAEAKREAEELRRENQALKQAQEAKDKLFKTLEEKNMFLKSENQGLKEEIENLKKTVSRLRKKKSKKSDSQKISYQSPITTAVNTSKKSNSKREESFNISTKNLRQMLQNELFLQEKDTVKTLKFSATQSTKPKGQDPRMIASKDKINPPYKIDIDLEEHEFYSNEYYQAYLVEIEERKTESSKRITHDEISFRLFKSGWKCITYKDKTKQEVKS